MGHLPFEQRTYTLARRGTHDITLAEPPTYSIPELIERGIVCLNKPKGPTSHMCSDYVQKILDISKAGHGGTLDPGVTGVLPTALGKSTRIVQALLTAGKEYVCLMHLHAERSEKDIRHACNSLIGTITQIPPVKSAVKRVSRERKIYYLEILQIEGRHVLYRVGCEAGTYIRKLCEQIGGAMNTNAHMEQLVRTKAGPFTDKHMTTLQELEDATGSYRDGDEAPLRKHLLPPESAIAHLPKVYAFDTALESVRHGVDLKLPGVALYDSDITAGDMVALCTTTQQLVALGTAKMSAHELASAEKGIAVRTDKVFMH